VVKLDLYSDNNLSTNRFSMVLLTFVDNDCFCCYLYNWFYSEINFYSI